jgi:hypothetical protein
MYPSSTEKFAFDISDKGGIGDTRYPTLDVEDFKRQLLKNKDVLFNIQNNKIILL